MPPLHPMEFRIAAGGKPEVFFDPAAKYIWP
jgi:hypothetical protein